MIKSPTGTTVGLHLAEATMTVNDIPANREELNKVERALALGRRERLLENLGLEAQGLRCWFFGAGWESRSLAEIPFEKIAEFVAKYA